MPHNRVPRELLPAQATAQAKGGMSSKKPDILLTVPAQDAGLPRHVIVEVKTCSDTRFREQLCKAKEQHAGLATALAAGGTHTAEVLPILVGVGGSIYKEHTIDALTKLGVSRNRAREGCAKIHRLMTQKLHAIVVARRQLERPADKCRHPGRPP